MQCDICLKVYSPYLLFPNGTYSDSLGLKQNAQDFADDFIKWMLITESFGYPFSCVGIGSTSGFVSNMWQVDDWAKSDLPERRI